MTTIFIPIFQGVEAKNILRTDIYKALMAQKDLRLVLFVKSRERADYYKKEFADPRIVYEIVESRVAPRLDAVFAALKFNLINTATIDLKRRLRLEETGNYFWYFFNWFFNRILARPLVRKIVRALDYLLVRKTSVAAYFEKYQPDLVFLAHLFDDIEIDFVREAKRRGIPTVGFINSWDKLTARCMIRLLPDKLLVYNEIVKAEAVKFADMKSKDIIITGIPQYDHYVTHPPAARGDFFKKIGLDPFKRLIVYAPMGKTFSNSDWDIIDLLYESIVKGRLPNVELLVRFQPNDFFDQDELKKRPWLKYDWPGVRFSTKRGVDWDMNFGDLEHLHDTLAHMSLLVCYASSMSVDAAVLDKPVINIGFEIKKQERLAKSPTYFYNMEHYKKALATGGIKMAFSKEELLEWINKYLANPELDRDGRRRLAAEQCWKNDGEAGKRIASVLL